MSVKTISDMIIVKLEEHDMSFLSMKETINEQGHTIMELKKEIEALKHEMSKV